MTSEDPPEEANGGSEGDDLPVARPSSRSDRRSSKSKGERRSLKGVGARFPWLERLVHHSWFEPLVTILAVVVILVSLYGYTGNWPPLVVVESSSMQHGTGDTLGDINTGDLVLVKQVSVPSQVTTYVQAEGAGGNSCYTTYGECGDVLLYYRYDQTSSTPIIHRAILWLSWLGNGSFAAPSLKNLTCMPAASESQYQIQLPNGGGLTCPTHDGDDTGLTGTIYLYNVGWASVTVEIALSTFAQPEAGPPGVGTIPPHSGYITMGDDNCADPTVLETCIGATKGEFDQIGNIVVGLVYPAWVEGVARGMIPWFGAIKLWLSGDAYFVPSETWVYLGLTIFAIIFIPTAVPRLYRLVRSARGDPSEDRAEEGGDGPGPPELEDVSTADDSTEPPAEPSELDHVS